MLTKKQKAKAIADAKPVCQILRYTDQLVVLKFVDGYTTKPMLFTSISDAVAQHMELHPELGK